MKFKKGKNKINFKDKLFKMDMDELFIFRSSLKNGKVIQNNKDISKDILETVDEVISMRVFAQELKKGTLWDCDIEYILCKEEDK